MPRPRKLLALALALAWVTLALADDAPPPALTAADFRPLTEWYGVYLKDKKIGWCRLAREKTDAEVTERFTMTLKLFSFGQKAEMEMSQTSVYDARPPYRLLRGDSRHLT